MELRPTDSQALQVDYQSHLTILYEHQKDLNKIPPDSFTLITAPSEQLALLGKLAMVLSEVDWVGLQKGI